VSESPFNIALPKPPVRHPTQPFAATPMNDRFGTTVPLVREAGIGAKQTLTHGAAADGPGFPSQRQSETDRPVRDRQLIGDRCGGGSFR
jgi:hypothetical protein